MFKVQRFKVQEPTPTPIMKKVSSFELKELMDLGFE